MARLSTQDRPETEDDRLRAILRLLARERAEAVRARREAAALAARAAFRVYG